MSEAIFKAIAQFAAKAIWGQIQKHMFKPEPDPIDAVLGGIKRIEELIEELDYKAQIRDPMNRIYYWTGRMQDVIADIQQSNSSPGSLKAYQELLDALRSESSGVLFQMYNIMQAVMGGETPLETKGLLAFWAKVAYEKLADTRNTKYFMQDYVDYLDNGVAAISALLYHGMTLSMFVASSEADAEKRRQNCLADVEKIRDRLFNTHYPPALRQFKQNNFDDRGLMLTQKWFNFYMESDRKRYMTIYAFWVRQVALSGGGPSSSIRSFRFVAQNTKAPLGPLQLHAKWEDNGNSRIKFYKDNPAGMGTEIAYTNSLRSGKTYAILFKLIPLAVEGNAAGRAPVLMVPYYEESSNLTQADRNNTFGNTWSFDVTSSPS